MSNALAISPSVMINRMVDREGTPRAASMAKVAELRLDLINAIAKEQFRAALASPTGEVDPLPLSSGAVVDKLI